MAKQRTDSPLTVSPDAAADLLGLAPNKVRQMINCGALPAFKVGKRWLISVKALEQWVDEQTNSVANQ